MFPAGTTQTPDIATLEKLRPQGKEMISQIQMSLIPGAGMNSTGSATELSYVISPGRTVVRDLGLSMSTGGSNGEVRLSYTTLLSPYALADYNKAMTYKLKSTEPRDDFTQKFCPHFLHAEKTFRIESVGRKMVVPLPVEGTPVRSAGTANPPVFFALITCDPE